MPTCRANSRVRAPCRRSSSCALRATEATSRVSETSAPCCGTTSMLMSMKTRRFCALGPVKRAVVAEFGHVVECSSTPPRRGCLRNSLGVFAAER